MATLDMRTQPINIDMNSNLDNVMAIQAKRMEMGANGIGKSDLTAKFGGEIDFDWLGVVTELNVEVAVRKEEAKPYPIDLGDGQPRQATLEALKAITAKALTAAQTSSQFGASKEETQLNWDVWTMWSEQRDTVQAIIDRTKGEKTREYLIEFGWVPENADECEIVAAWVDATVNNFKAINPLILQAGCPAKKNLKAKARFANPDRKKATLQHFESALSEAIVLKEKHDARIERQEKKTYTVEGDNGQLKGAVGVVANAADRMKAMFDTEQAERAEDPIEAAADAARGAKLYKEMAGLDPRTPDEILAAGAKAKEEWREEQEHKERKALIDGAMSRLAAVEAEEKAARQAG